jgi:hypothetical protein
VTARERVRVRVRVRVRGCWTRRAFLAVTLATAGGCARSAPPLVLPFVADTNAVEVIAPGVLHRSIRTRTGPWAIEALDVDLTRCYSAVAMKGAPGAAGRRKTSELLAELRATREVIGGVNADFFTLAGFQGVPTGALIHEGVVIVGPGNQPVLSIDSAGVPRAGALGQRGSVTTRNGSRPVAGWNRTVASGLNVYDERWGAVLDTATGIIEVIVGGAAGTEGRVVRVDTALTGSVIPRNGSVIVAGRTASADLRQWLQSLVPGDSVHVTLALTPFHPREAVGGRPMLLRDSVVAPEVDTEGQESFRNRNPRTAVGIANNGKRLILVVIDGRRAGYSEGTTLRETADIMKALGARDAINLDGGGSSALVYVDPSTKALRVANRPSDATGERAVGDALAIVKGCGR